MLVEYVGENFKLPSQKDGPTSVNGKSKLGVWYINERNNSHTTARGDHMQGMKAIVSILYRLGVVHFSMLKALKILIFSYLLFCVLILIPP
jgi:hypothetical protein